MPHYRHVLVAVDFSEHGNEVARKARYLAEMFQARLSVIHVLDNIPMPHAAYGSIIPLDELSTYELLEAEKSKLKQIADKLGVESAQRWMVWGVPGEEIVRLAEREKVDLIVIGSHGRHGLALLLGSTANDVLHHVNCDVMAVRLRDEATEEEPFYEKPAFNPSG